MKMIAAIAFALAASLAAPVHAEAPAVNPEAIAAVDAVAFVAGQCAVSSTGQRACFF